MRDYGRRDGRVSILHDPTRSIPACPKLRLLRVGIAAWMKREPACPWEWTISPEDLLELMQLGLRAQLGALSVSLHGVTLLTHSCEMLHKLLAVVADITVERSGLEGQMIDL